MGEDKEKYCPHCGKKKTEGWSVQVKKDGKNVVTIGGCDGSCNINESGKSTDKKVLKG